MSKQPGAPTIKIFLRHAEWLRAQGPSYKRQAASCKRQAHALVLTQYGIITKVERNNMYTLEEIIEAWENNYGGDMKKDYPRFIKELIKNAS